MSMNNYLSWFIMFIKKFMNKRELLSRTIILAKDILSSTVVQSIINFFAAIIAGVFFCVVIDNNDIIEYYVNWGFIFPFCGIYFFLLFLFSISNKYKSDCAKNAKLLDMINQKIYEILIVQQTQLSLYQNGSLGSNTPFDIIAQSVSDVIHDIICKHFNLKSIKVTIVKRCLDENYVEMCAFKNTGGNVPSLYKSQIEIKKGTRSKILTCVEMFKNNQEIPLILRNEEEVLDKFKKDSRKKINTKQFIALPGIIDGQVVILLQIAINIANVFNEEDFTLITDTITPSFLQILCNMYKIEIENLK